ncbi:MAG: protein kinase domain-containing protein, partial [Persicimonas sp.]
MQQTFGKYELIEKIGEGGMAEVFLARQRGDVAGFEKSVALKRIFPHLTDREDLVVMFLDEARIAAQLNHPNIVQVYDLGNVDDTLYIAMEYVDGRDLRHICEVGIERENFVSKPMAARIVAEAAAGLHYAHTSTDDQGNPRNIVHRDVSPQNILVSMEGQVKVGDFGVAKAEDRLGKTRSGQRKGKLSYMSPEQFEADKVDARSDVYTLGIVLYETTVRTRLFRGKSDFETMNLIANAKVTPPSQVRPEFPADLEAIIMKALSKEPEDRFQSAHEFQVALEDWLHEHNQRVGRVEVTAYMRELFPEGARSAANSPQPTSQPAGTSKAAQSAPKHAQAPGSGRPPGGGPPGGRPPGGRPSAGGPAANRPPGAGGPPGQAGRPPKQAQQPQQALGEPQADGGWEIDDEPVDLGNRRVKIFAALGAVAALVVVGIVLYNLENREAYLASDEDRAKARALAEAAEAEIEIPDSPDFVDVELATEPDSAFVVINGKRAEAKTPGRFELVAGESNDVVFYHPQYPPERITVDGESGAAPEAVEFEPFDTEPETGTLVIKSDPSGGIVYVNGERLGAAPQTVEDLPATFDHHVEVRKTGRWSFAGFFQLVPGEKNAFQVPLHTKEETSRRQYVELTVDAVPKGSTVRIDGETTGVSPLSSNEDRNTLVSVDMDKKFHDSKQRRILLEDIGAFTLRTFLVERERGEGELTVGVDAEEATIYIDSNSYPDNPVENVKLTEGSHKVVFETPGG